MNILSQAPAFVQKHKNVALVTVVTSSGSTPRHAGTHMLVSASGDLIGSVGGGRVEMQVVELGRAVAKGAPMATLKLNLVQDVAMCCGGSMEFLVEAIDSVLVLLDQINAAHLERRAVCVRSDLVRGGKTLVDADPGKPAVYRDESYLWELLRPHERLVLFGCGHLARSIGPLARLLEFEVVLCDDNQTGAVDRTEPWATRVISSFDLRDIEKQMGALGHGDYLLILTRDHAIDQQIVEETLPRADEFDYLGLIGSLGKVGRFKKRVLAKGIANEAQWAKLRAPMGLDIQAETPQEIAVSIMGELIRLRSVRRQG